MQQSKSIFASKTFWFNLITGLIAFSEYVTGDMLTAIGIDPLNQHKIMAATGAVIALGNIVLRSLNGAPVSLTPKADNAVNK